MTTTFPISKEMAEALKALKTIEDRLPGYQTAKDIVRAAIRSHPDAKYMKERIAVLEKALLSISKNTCCGIRQEAKLVAQKALSINPQGTQLDTTDSHITFGEGCGGGELYKDEEGAFVSDINIGGRGSTDIKPGQRLEAADDLLALVAQIPVEYLWNLEGIGMKYIFDMSTIDATYRGEGKTPALAIRAALEKVKA